MSEVIGEIGVIGVIGVIRVIREIREIGQMGIIGGDWGVNPYPLRGLPLRQGESFLFFFWGGVNQNKEA